MTQQLEVSILAAPLAAIDRRVLSQAWYAALRLGRRPPPIAAPNARQDGFSHAPVRAHRPQRRLATQPARGSRVWSSHATREPRIGESAQRASSVARAVRPQLAGAIEKAFGDAELRRATFTVGRGRARIVVVMQTRGNRTTLIALCRPHLQAAVARALAQARVALEARGTGVERREHGRRTCS